MYCSNCGNKVTEGLNYCNRCGGKVQGIDSVVSESVAERLASSLRWIGFGGFIALIALVAMMLKDNILDATVVTIIAMFLTTLFGICFLILWQISKLTASQSNSTRVDSSASAPAGLESKIPDQLEQPQQPPASVVENTTRTLDKVPVTRD